MNQHLAARRNMATSLSSRDEHHSITMSTAAGILFWLCALFIFYETAIPFQFDLSPSGLRYRWQRSEFIPFLDSDGSLLSIADAIGNVVLFVPFGFFLHCWRLIRRAGASVDSASWRWTLSAALFYSTTIEILQLFLDYRTTSANDLTTNTTGAYIGFKLACAYPDLINTVWQAMRRVLRTRPALVLWLLTMLVQALLALSPFDFTLQQENFQRQMLRWQYSWQALPALGQAAPQNWLGFLRNFPHPEQLMVVLIITIGFGTLLGVFWALVCHRYGAGSSRLFWGSTLVTFGFYPVLTLLQFMVQSVRPLVLFPIIGGSCLILGALLMMACLRLIFSLPGRRGN
jgi:glycopeptide antibiotics resistance protein